MTDGIRIADLPDLGAVTDEASFVGELAGSGKFSALALLAYLGGGGGGGGDDAALSAEVVARIAADAAEAVSRAVADVGEAAARAAADALLAPLNSPALTGTPTTPTPPDTDQSSKVVNSVWVGNYLTALGYVPTGVAPVTSVAGRTGTVTLTHNDLTDWAASIPVASVAGRTGTVTLTHSDLTDWAAAIAGLLTIASAAATYATLGALTTLTARVAAIEANYIKTD